jgi:hypothetical protein
MGSCLEWRIPPSPGGQRRVPNEVRRTHGRGHVHGIEALLEGLACNQPYDQSVIFVRTAGLKNVFYVSANRMKVTRTAEYVETQRD